MKVSEQHRFWSHVVKGPREGDCWIWTGAVADDGYGRFWTRANGTQRVVRPQRYAYRHITGAPLDPSTMLLHTCDVPICVHAAIDDTTHLTPGTHRDNMADRSTKMRATNAPALGWRSIGRQQFAARSRQLRDVVKIHGWDTGTVPALIAGYDPTALTLF